MGQKQSKKSRKSKGSSSKKKKKRSTTVSPLKDSLRRILPYASNDTGSGRSRSSCNGVEDDDDDDVPKRGKREETTTTSSKLGERSWMTGGGDTGSDDTLRGVLQALDRMGLMRMCKVSVGISFSSTNDQPNKSSFRKKKSNNNKKNKKSKRRSLHAVDPSCRWLTPYEEVIVSMSRSLEILALPDGQIPCYGFGDEQSLDESIFPFIRNRPCEDFDEVHRRYRFISQNVRFGGKASIAPLIYNAIDQVQKGGFHYHILVIISDQLYTTTTDTACKDEEEEEEAKERGSGEAAAAEDGEDDRSSYSHSFSFRSTRSNTSRSQAHRSLRHKKSSISSILSDAFVDGAVEVGRAEEEIKKAIVEASNYPLSIIFIGVGDDQALLKMEEKFCRQLPGQMFNNFGIVNYTHCSSSVQNFEQRQIPFVYQILRLVAVHYTSIEMLYQIMLKVYHEKCLREEREREWEREQESESRSSRSGVKAKNKNKWVSGMPRELLNADRSYRKMFSPLAAHIRKMTSSSVETTHGKEREEGSIGGGGTIVDVEQLLSPSIEASIHSTWTDEELSSPQMNSPLVEAFSPPSAPNYADICKNLDSLGLINTTGESFDKLKQKLKIKRKETIPPIFVCPITQEMMIDPVIAEDGYTYERKDIEEWLSSQFGHRRSPMTNKEMKTLNLIPNYALRSAIREWQERHG